MSLSRSELKNKFNPGSNAVPTAADYSALINSVLNLRDDQFYGVWKPDGIYYNGGVVFYNKAFYQLQFNPDEPYCAITAPYKDSTWCKVQESITDDDWFFSADKLSLHANPIVTQVGIGTDNPQATLEVAAKDYGTIKLQPNLKDPQLVIINKDPNCVENSLVLRVNTEASEIETDAEKGLRIFKINKDANQKQAHILTANATKSAEPRVGIGVDQASAHLEVQKEGKGSVKIDGGEVNGNPKISIEKNAGSWISLESAEELAQVLIHNNQGLHFNKNTPDGPLPQVVIDEYGNLGVGVSDPTARVHVETYDERDGAIKLDFCKTYPVINLINNRVPDANGNYNNAFAIGAATDHAVLKTDSSLGFAFKIPAKMPANELNVCDLNDGISLVHIYPQGVTTVGDLAAGNFKLDVDAFERSYGSYTVAERSKIDAQNCEAVSEVLPRLCALNPVRFKWKTLPYGADPAKWELGLIADEVKPQFPEVVMDESVTYGALVPVLIKAIKEQQTQIKSLDALIAQMDARLKLLEA